MDKHEIKQLAKGQAILVEARFLTMRDGDVEYFTEMVDKGVSNIHWSKPENILLASSKPNLFRKFKAGDMVSPCFWYDRPPVAAEDRVNSEFMPEDGVYEVKADERNSIVYIDYHGKSVFIPACHLELMTPVEERETAAIFDDKKRGMWVVTKDNFTHAYFPYRLEVSDNIANSKEQAQAAAEAERDRLNAEWRKEMGK